jgi:hypothetical protein
MKRWIGAAVRNTLNALLPGLLEPEASQELFDSISAALHEIHRKAGFYE